MADEQADKVPDRADQVPETTGEAPEQADKAAEPADKAPEPADRAPEPADNALEQVDKAPEQADKAPERADQAPERADKAREKRVRSLFKVAGFLVVAVGYVVHQAMRMPFARTGMSVGRSQYGVNITLMQDLAADLTGKGSKEVQAMAHHLASCFVLSQFDDATSAFLERSKAASRDRIGWWTLYVKGFFYERLQLWLGWSRTDASSWLRYKDMFVASPAQFRAVLKAASADLPQQKGLLDVGAGNGLVTAALLEAMDGAVPEDVLAMEASRPLLKSLASRGYRAAPGFDELESGESFGLVSLLNLLDRCDSPRKLVELALERMRPRGALVVATVIPFCSLVHIGRWGSTQASRRPRDPLQIRPDAAACKAKPKLELGVAAFAAAAFQDLPVTVRSWTRVPYLSSGDSKTTHFRLDNILFVLQRKS